MIATVICCLHRLSLFMWLVMVDPYPSCCPVANANDVKRPGMMQLGKSGLKDIFLPGIILRSQFNHIYEILNKQRKYFPYFGAFSSWTVWFILKNVLFLVETWTSKFLYKLTFKRFYFFFNLFFKPSFIPYLSFYFFLFGVIGLDFSLLLSFL